MEVKNHLLNLIVTAIFTYSSASHAEQICERIAHLEDKGELSDYKIGLSHEVPINVDLDRDGSLETLQLHGPFAEVSVNEDRSVAPEYKSVYARQGGVVEIDGEHFGVIRSTDILAMIWSFKKSDQNAFEGEPVCFFDREWTETGCGLNYSEDKFERVKFKRPDRFPNLKTDSYRPPFLDDVFEYHKGVADYGDGLKADFDNDGREESIGTILISFPSPDPRVLEMPVALAADGKVAPTFQNARLVQFLSREKRKLRQGTDDAGLLLPKEKAAHVGVLIEDRFEPEMLIYGGPHKPYRQIYQLQGSWPSVLCKSNFEWRTVYTLEDQR
ncbi:MAG: hypothetical protein AAGD92_13370 [Pseudomonadota bacterium]